MSTVQTWQRSPASWQRATTAATAAGCEARSRGSSASWPCGGHLDVGQGVAREHEQPGGHARRDLAHPVDRGAEERRHDDVGVAQRGRRARWPPAAPGPSRGSPGKFLISTLTPNPPNPAQAAERRRPSVGQPRRRARSFAAVCSTIGPTPGDRPGSWSDEHAVGGPADIELDPVGAEFGGQPEGLEGVLPGDPRRAPVAERGGGRRRASGGRPPSSPAASRWGRWRRAEGAPPPGGPGGPP